jgi:putative glycosyltransferase (TIGR04372 family)
MLKRLFSSLKRYQIWIHGFWALPCVLLIRTISPFICVRFCEIRSERIGHFIADTCEHICRQHEKEEKIIDFFYFKKVSNLQWEKMIKRSELKLCNSWIQYIDRWNRKIPGGKLHSVPSSFTFSRDLQGLYSKYECNLEFRPEEQESCENWLKAKGWKNGDKFVVFLVRDSAYQEGYLPNNRDWNYHNYRNSDIQTFIPVMNWLAEQGIWVLRMGKAAKTQITLNNKFIIDYAFDETRSDLLDIWLFSNSNAIVSTGSGLDYLGGIFRIPILLINYVPLSHLFSYFSGMCVPKKLLWRSDNTRLTITEMLENSFLKSEDFSNHGISIIDLDEQEILNSFIEFWNLFGLKGESSDTFRQVNAIFWKILENNHQYLALNNWRHPDSFISEVWLNGLGLENLK